jgi:hypothetical protein
MRKPSLMLLIRLMLAALLLAGLGACATTRNEGKMLEETLVAHASLMRWGDPLGSIEFVDPEVREKHGLTGLERERWRQFRMAGYRAQPPAMLAEGQAQVVAEVELINRHTQAARSLTWRQEWRFDAEAKRWWLLSELPSLEAEGS